MSLAWPGWSFLDLSGQAQFQTFKRIPHESTQSKYKHYLMNIYSFINIKYQGLRPMYTYSISHVSATVTSHDIIQWMLLVL